MLEQVAGARRRWVRIRWAGRSARVLNRAALFRPAHPIATIRLARDVRRWGPLAGAVLIAARRWPDSIGLVDDRGALTFGELDRRSNALAWAWRGQGIRQDSAIGVLCRNHRGVANAMFAAAKLGAQVVPMPTAFGAEQLAAVVQREGVTTIVYDQEFGPVVAALPERVGRYLAWDDGSGEHVTLNELIAAAPAHALPVPAEPGGLTLVPKASAGVPCRVSPTLFAAQFLDRIPMQPGPATLIGVPLFRGYGLAPFLVALSLGSTAVLQRDADAQHLRARAVRYRCTTVVVTPRLLSDLLDASGPAPSTVRVVLCSGAPLAPDLGNRVTLLFGDVLYNWYCPAESLLAAVATPADWRAAPGTVGYPPFGCQVALLHPTGRRIVEPGRSGDIHVGNRAADGLLACGAVGHFDRAGRLFLDGVAGGD